MSNEMLYQRPPQEIAERLDVERRLGGLEEFKVHVATKADIEEVKGLISQKNTELRAFIDSSVLKSENRTLREFLKNWTIGAGLAVPAITAFIVFLLQIAFK